MGRSTEYTKLADVDDHDVEAHGNNMVPPSYPLKQKTRVAPRKTRRRSCCALLCYILLALMALCLVFVTVLGTGAYFWTRHQVKRFTVTEPLDLPIHEVPREQLEIVKDRSKLFVDTIAAGQVPDQDLTITVDELNGFLAHSDFLRGHAFVTVEKDSIQMDLSLPATGLPGGKGRYFVATGGLEVSLEDEEEDEPSSAVVTTKLETLHPIKNVDGPLFVARLLMYWQDVTNQRFTDRFTHQLIVNLQSGAIMGKAAPQEFIDEKQNLVEHIYDEYPHDHHHHNHDHHRDHHHHHHHHHDDDDCDPAAFLDGIASVSFKDGAMTIHARRDGNRNAGSNTNMVATSTTTTTITPAVGRAKTWTDHGTRKLQALSKWILL